MLSTIGFKRYAQAAKYLGVSERTLDRLIVRFSMKRTRIGSFYYINNNTLRSVKRKLIKLKTSVSNRSIDIVELYQKGFKSKEIAFALGVPLKRTQNVIVLYKKEKIAIMPSKMNDESFVD